MYNSIENSLARSDCVNHFLHQPDFFPGKAESLVTDLGCREILPSWHLQFQSNSGSGLNGRGWDGRRFENRLRSRCAR